VVDEVIDESDILLEIVDARVPNLTRNRRVESKIWRKRKFLILVMNKSDLITRRMKMEILKKSKAREMIFVSCKKRTGISKLRGMISKLAKKKPHWRNVKVGVVGYPNTGKSTVINALVGRSVARTSSTAGMTRGVQWVKGKGKMMFLDTPGVIPPDEKDEAEKAIMSIIDPNKLVNSDIAAMRIIQLFLDNNKRNLERFYDVKIGNEDTFEILLKIGKRKNFIKKGGEVDEIRTALTIVRDWQNGKLLLKTFR
jgi:ribosome biogenesis GTPase A